MPMDRNPLKTTLLDLHALLGDRVELLIGGGYGLFLKQLYLQAHPEIRTLFPRTALPSARTTQDIDLILRAEVVTDSESMRPIREALDSLGFEVVESAKYTQFARKTDAGTVKIDFLAAPLGDFAQRVPKDSRRVKPRPSVKLHASKMEEAVAVERHPLEIPIEGVLSSGEPYSAKVFIPQAFSYLLMKLCAFRDRMDDEDKQLGQHHALDIYRIVGLLTRAEDADVRALSAEFATDPTVIAAREIASVHFIDEEGIGRLRIREHQLFLPTFDLERFATELGHLLNP